uniref:helix-turn-helix transcriptional regulator n=1 Tax=Streptomyces cadmiisoli TaxID=2184053 RepID=UPI003D738CE7
VLSVEPAASDTGNLIGTALGKVVKALPESVGQQAALLRQYASAVPDPYTVRPDPAVTSSLVDAVADRRRVRVTYRSDNANEWEAEVDPWSIVIRYGRWYLLCHSHRADAIRTYRIDRVHSVRPTEHGFKPPEDLDPVAVLEENLGKGWEFSTRVIFDAPLREVAPWIRPPMGRLEPLGDGCVLVGSTRNPDMYAQEWLARIPFSFLVDGGKELRTAVSTLATRLTAAVNDQP